MHNLYNKNFSEIRLLPMHDDDFNTYDDVIDWFNRGMYKGQGVYYHKKKSIHFIDNILVMFQYKGQVIATAIMVDYEKLEQPTESGYYGIYYFDLDTISILREPISSIELMNIEDRFSGFSRALFKFTSNNFDEIVNFS